MRKKARFEMIKLFFRPGVIDFAQGCKVKNEIVMKYEPRVMARASLDGSLER